MAMDAELQKNAELSRRNTLKLLQQLAEPQRFTHDELGEKVNAYIALIESVVDSLERGLEKLRDVEQVIY